MIVHSHISVQIEKWFTLEICNLKTNANFLGQDDGKLPSAKHFKCQILKSSHYFQLNKTKLWGTQWNQIIDTVALRAKGWQNQMKVAGHYSNTFHNCAAENTSINKQKNPWSSSFLILDVFKSVFHSLDTVMNTKKNTPKQIKHCAFITSLFSHLCMARWRDSMSSFSSRAAFFFWMSWSRSVGFRSIINWRKVSRGKSSTAYSHSITSLTMTRKSLFIAVSFFLSRSFTLDNKMKMTHFSWFQCSSQMLCSHVV